MAKSNFRIGEAVVDSIKLGLNDTAIYLGAEKMYPLASYLTFDIKVGGDIKWSGSTTGNSLSYSKNGGKTWTSVNSADTISVAAGDKISWKGTPTPETSKGIGIFSGDSAARYDINGNAMSLLYGDNYDGQDSLSGKNYVFYRLFSDNTNVVDASEMTLPATTLSNYCYNAMFSGCTSLTAAPELPATTLSNYCYKEMFIGCTSLTTTPELPATTLASYCYQNMFSNCSSLTTVTELPATTLVNSCYANMFSNCTSLTTAPSLPATTLGTYCYSNMFYKCTSLTTAPSTLPATTLLMNCYQGMFNGCTSLTTAPELPATTLVSNCYSMMFYNCSSLNYIKAMFTTTPGTSYTSNWVSGVTSSGTFIKSPSATWTTTGVHGVPSGWIAGTDKSDITGTTQLTSPTYITVTNATSIMCNKKSSYQTVYISKDHTNWTEMVSGTVYVTNDSTIYMCGNLSAANTSTNYTNFGIGGNNVSLTGNLSSVWSYDDVNAVLKNYCGYGMFSGCTSLTTAPVLSATSLANYCYGSMFSGCTSLTTAPSLPATTLSASCYSNMFNGCTSLTTAPSLPATTLANYCYLSMFKNCTSLITAPVLSATALKTSCYSSMFAGCTSLTAAPSLPATALKQGCYSSMFAGCTSLTAAPVLSATTMVNSCYDGMFSGCTSLTAAPELPATTSSDSCYQYMFAGCTSLTAAPSLPATALTPSCYARMFAGCTSLTAAPVLSATTMVTNCYNGMFSGCTSLTAAPELPATTLSASCYQYMFNGCTSLTTAPELSATTLVGGCYQYMFSGCTSLSYIKALFTTEPTTAYTNNWVSNVASSGTFVMNPDATWDTGTTTCGTSTYPCNWTVEIEHAYVEIGGLKWATMNIGATGVTDYGLYFQWGDTQGYTFDQVTGSSTPHKDFGWADYKYGNGTSSPGVTGITKYNSSDGLTVLELVDDAARANWGGSWRMPTSGEMQSLIDSTTTAWTADYQGSGVSGVVFTDKTDSSKVLFFPAAGYCEYGSVNVGSSGSYWSSSLDSGRVQRARCLSFSSGGSSVGYYGRYSGFSVRPVAD